MLRRCLAAVVLAWAAVSTGAFAASRPVLCDEGFLGPVCAGNPPTLALNLTAALPSTVAFSRGSNATQNNSAGQLVYAPNNLALQSASLTTAPWAVGSLGVSAPVLTANASVAPDGTTTATQLALPAVSVAGNVSNLNQSITVNNGTATFSVYLKGAVGGEQTYISFLADNSTTYVRQRVTLTTAWQRFSVSGTLSGGSVARFPAIGTDLRDGSQTSTVAETIYAWGGQFELTLNAANSPGTYNATGASAYFGPRFDYDPVALTPKGLLIEEARTNLALQSNGFSTAPWGTINLTPSAAAVASPDGSNNAWSLNEGAANSQHFFQQSITVPSGVTAAAAFFLKQDTGRYVILGIIATDNATGPFAVLDTQTGTITQAQAAGVSTFVSAAVQSVGNGWYRLQVVGSIAGNTAYRLNISNSQSPTPGVPAPTYIGTSAKTLAYGAQLEQAAFPTSYEPTTTAAVTRSADVATVATSVFAYNPSAMTIVTTAIFGNVNSGGRVIGTNGLNAEAYPQISSTGPVTLSFYDAGSSPVTPNGVALGSLAKMAVAWDAAKEYITLNAGAVASGAIGTTDSDYTNFQLGARSVSGNPSGQVWFQGVQFYNRRLPNSQLQSLTH